MSGKGSRLFAEHKGVGGPKLSKCEGKESIISPARSSPKNASCVCLVQGRGSKLMKDPLNYAWRECTDIPRALCSAQPGEAPPQTGREMYLVVS